MNEESNAQIPGDFPRCAGPGSVSGFQPKIAVRLVKGRFIEGWTDAERRARFDACADLVDQLCVFCRRKLSELPPTDLTVLLPRVRRGVAAKGWNLSDGEFDWIFKRVKIVLSEDSSSTKARH